MAATALPAVAAQIANSRRSADLEWRKSPALRRQLFYGRLTTGRDAAQEVRLFGLGDFLRGRMLAEMRSINQGQRSLDRRVLSVEGVLSLAGCCATHDEARRRIGVRRYGRVTRRIGVRRYDSHIETA